ncbi:MAG: hypothetical protein KJZ83_23720 [Burkholderiaceae bacterium]|nr:hypothetical protein [Burkholderiaceae bacterium]
MPVQPSRNNRSSRKPRLAPADAQFLTDPQGAALLGVGLTKFHELQQHDPDFPPAVWFGSRSKRHVRDELRAYALEKRAKVGECPRKVRGGLLIETA